MVHLRDPRLKVFSRDIYISSTWKTLTVALQISSTWKTLTVALHLPDIMESTDVELSKLAGVILLALSAKVLLHSTGNISLEDREKQLLLIKEINKTG